MRQIIRKKVFVGLSGGVDSSVSATLLSARIGGSAYSGGKSRPKVFVGLSGGVDSSVSALLLKQAGYDVTGVFIRVWQPDFFECTWKDDRLDAMRVCAKLNIPFVELDLEKEYKKEVVDYMLREYKAGKTPNPDVMCNRYIKFGGFYKFARKCGADFIATGHYSRIGMREARNSPPANRRAGKHEALRSRLRTSNFELLTSSDPDKDQSYFLWQIRKEQLPHILFPIGGMKKPEVRKLAKKFGLITADKKDSQGLCFIGKVDMKEFLSHYIKPTKGGILNEKGKVIGRHEGALFYTLGERVSASLPPSLEGGIEGGCFVIGKDVKKNTLTVSTKSPEGTLGGAVTEITLKDCNWLLEPISEKTYQARTRYRQPMERCRVLSSPSFLRGRAREGVVLVRFESPQTAAHGQSLVLYDGEVCIGGGIIS